jgi:thiosulfate/3-mercaptopyruvate sulfurtransferase
MKPAEALLRLFREAGIDMRRPVLTTCGSGITASHLALALHLLGHKDVAVYDGSWSEWGSRTDTPVETGAPSRKAG